MNIKNWIFAILLVFVPISIAGNFLHWDVTTIFLSACLAIVPLAAYMGKATEEIAVVVGPNLGGLLNATFGNDNTGCQTVQGLVGSFLGNASLAAVSGGLIGLACQGNSTAELNGRVTDTSGGVLPGATVSVTQTATGLNRTAVSDESGAYLLSNLPPGPYRLEVSLQGFKTYVQTGITLTVGATPTINASLAIGSLEESVTVAAAAPGLRWHRITASWR